MREIHRILFIRTDRMGDVLMNLPAIRLLRQTFPKAWITLLVDVSVADIFRGHSDIDEVMTVDAKKIRVSPAYRRETIKKVKSAGFDLAVVSNPDKFLHWLVFLAHIPHRIGYDRKWSILLTKKMVDAKATASRHEMDLNLELASLASDKTWDGKLSIPTGEAAEKAVQVLMDRECGARPVLAVHVGTSNPMKRWPLESFVEFCGKALKKNAACVVLVGGPEEIDFSRRIKEAIGLNLVDFTGKLSLAELVAFLRHSKTKVLVSADSGPVHIAWIGGTPVVAFYAKNVEGSNPVRWGPRDGKSEVIYKAMSDISPQEAFELTEKVMERKA